MIKLKKRKKKIDFYTLVNLIQYYDFYRCKVNNIYGCIYKCDNISQYAVKKLSKYNNIRFFNGYSQYAPEIKLKAIFVGDKCF